ncbi:MAG: hypothetical protein IJZ64_02360, partial [Ruminococcus sp.]|nr:hypothetical protein [Ruminococcus sp.]
MKIFQSTFKSLSTFNSIKQARKEHITPVSLTGLSLVQRAQLAYTLSEEENILIITGDEAEAKRLCDDINTMANENIAMPFPSHELVLAQIESVSYEYVYSRISAL